MLVYGDLAQTIGVAERLRDIELRLYKAGDAAGSQRGELLARALVEAGGLAQGLIDTEFEATGADDITPIHTASLALCLEILRSSEIAPGGAAQALATLAATPHPETVTERIPEGYAFYAVYPENYRRASADWPWTSPPFVIGLRSIGTGLAACVAAAASAKDLISVRPTGPPFARELRLSEPLAKRLAAHKGPFAIVDEGPGLSGSSFGCVADALEGLGVTGNRLVFFPSHTSPPGPEASPRHASRWGAAQRAVRTLDDLLTDEPMESWFTDVTGSVESIEDFSGGAWRSSLFGPGAAWPPVNPGMERRKFRLTSGRGRWLAKFAGLGPVGEEKWRRALALHRNGFGPQSLALRRGFLLQQWEEGDALVGSDQPPPFLDHLARYIAFRARTFPAGQEAGADPDALRLMAITNAARLGGPEVAGVLDRRPPSRGLKRIEVDSRLHPWEWLRRPDGSYCKLDAVDHARGHDLIGCQPMEWDIAGAAVEFALSADQLERLCAEVARAGHVRPDAASLPFFRICYAAFMSGLWTMAEAADQEPARRQKDFYQRVLAGTASEFAACPGGPVQRQVEASCR